MIDQFWNIFYTDDIWEKEGLQKMARFRDFFRFFRYEFFALSVVFVTTLSWGAGYDCTGDQFATSDGCATPKFSIELDSSGTQSGSNPGKFFFSMTATGTFYVECGFGGTLKQGDTVLSGNKITRTDTTPTIYTCEPSDFHESPVIKFGVIGNNGVATGYRSSINTGNGNYAAISFFAGPTTSASVTTAKSENTAKITGISGSLGAIFPTLTSGINKQPCFNSTFRGATNLFGGLPSELFTTESGTSISGAPVSYMFAYTFYGANVGTLPDELFHGLRGSPQTGVFYNTFAEASDIDIPDSLFCRALDYSLTPSTSNSLYGTAGSMFYRTFYNSNLMVIPPNLFKCVQGAGRNSLFYQTFYGTPISYMPANLFSGITDISSSVSNMYYQTFYNSEYLDGFVDDNNNALSGNYIKSSYITGATNNNNTNGMFTGTQLGTDACPSGYTTSTTITNAGKTVCDANYTISYSLGSGGTHGTDHPTSATYNAVVHIDTPTRSNWVFNGWTITNMDSTHHYYGSTSTPTSTSTSSTLSPYVGYTYFKNLRASPGTVTFTANWVCPAGKTLNTSTGACDKCPAGTYKDSAGNGSCTACPAITRDSGAVMPASSYPASWHLNEGGTDYLWEAKIQNWSTGLESISQCRAIYTFENTRGIVRNEGIYYNTTTQKYDTVGEYAHDYYIQIKPGYYGSTQLYDGTSACSSADSTRNMLYQDAIQCPAGSYCPGFVDTNWWAMGVPKCNDANYDYTQSTIGKYTCVSNDLSNAGADSCVTTVALDANGGTPSILSPVYVRYNKGVYSTLANAKDGINAIDNITTKPKKSSNRFTGFSIGGTQTINSSGVFTNAAKTQVELNGTLKTWTAQYTPVYTITLEKQNGTGGTTTLYAASGAGLTSDQYGTDFSITSVTTPTLTGYTFNGYWSTTSGTGTQYIDANGNIISGSLGPVAESATANFSIYARWTPNQYTITLDNNSATTAGSTTLYTKYNTGVYLDSARSVAMSTSANGITVPEKTGWTFRGYYSANAANATQYIDANGKITSSGLSAGRGYTSNGIKWYARWSKTCPAGQYFASDQTCKNCAAGSFCFSSTTGYNYTTTDITYSQYCPVGSYSSAGASTCTVCPAGRTTGNIGTAFNTNANTTCNETCSNSSNVATWTTPEWLQTGSSDFTVNNTCTISTCSTGYNLNNGACTPNTCTITYKTGSNTIGTQNFTYGGTLTELTSLANYSTNVPAGLKANEWSFYGWSTGADSTIEFNGSETSVTSLCTTNGTEITLYGVWGRRISFTHYESASATSVSTNGTEQFYYNTSASAAGTNAVSTYPLYTSTQNSSNWAPLGWATSSTATSASVTQTGSTTTTVTPAYNAAAPTYYAVYSRTPTVSYNANGGNGTVSATNCNTQTYNAGGTAGSTPSCTLSSNYFTKNNSVQTKWAAGSASGTQKDLGGTYTVSNTAWASDRTATTMYAIWDTCTACSAGTGATCSLSVVNNVCTYTTSCKTGYSNIQNNGKYNPSCTANTNTITLNANGATSGKIKNTAMTNGTVTFTCTTDSSMTPPTWSATDSADTTSIIKANNKFIGWSTSSTCTTSSCVNMPTTCPTGNTTYYAVWAPLYTLTLNNNRNGGSSDVDLWYFNSTGVYTDNNGTTPVAWPITIPSRNGYTFAGYKYNSSTIINSNGQDVGGSFWQWLKGTVTYSITLNADWTQCVAGSYCPGDNTSQTCPTAYPNSDAGASLITQCYSNTKSRAWTGSQVDGEPPTGCTVTAWNACSVDTCDYVAYSNASGNGDGTIKSGCSTNASNCTKTVKTVSANNGYYAASGATSCTACPVAETSSGYSYVSGTGWTSYSQCKESKPYSSVSANCASGALTKTASSASEWGTAVSTLAAKTGYEVTGSGNSATCSISTYTITYTLNNGTNNANNPSSYNVTTETITLADPTKTGYTFGGWYTEAAFTNQVTQIAKGSTGNKTFYAKWTANTYTIVYNVNKPSGASSNVSGSTANSSHTYDTAKNLTSNGYTLKGWTFQGWATSPTGSVAYTNGQSVSNLTTTNSGTVNLYAVWAPNCNTITLDSNGGTAGSVTTLYKKTDYETLYYNNTCTTQYTTDANVVPTRQGYTLLGYFDSAEMRWINDDGSVGNVGTETTENVTLYAGWVANCNAITFDNTTRGGNTSNTTLYKYTGDTKWYSSRTDATTCATAVTTTAVPSKSNASFAGYYTSATDTTTSVGSSASPSVLSTAWTVTGPATVYAHYNCGTHYNQSGTDIAGTCNPNTYTITLSTSDGSTTIKEVYNTKWTDNAGNTITTVTSPTKTGYTFGGWVDGGGNVKIPVTGVLPATTTFANHTSLYAYWTTVTYTIESNYNDGTCATPNPTTYNIETNTITLCTPTKTGYTFGGWYTSSNFSGSAVEQIAKGSTGNKTFYAHWTANQYTVTYAGNGNTSGTVPSNHTCSYDDTCTAGAQGTLLKTNNTFSGWTVTCKKSDGITACTPSVSTIAAGGSLNNVTAEDGATITLTAIWNGCACGNDTNATCAVSGVANNVCQYTHTCTTGYYHTSNGSAITSNSLTCTICPAGSACPAGATVATLCAAGSYTSTTGQSACTACQNGTTNAGTNATTQQTCGTTCSNATGVRSNSDGWVTATWAANSVTNACTIKSTGCSANNYKNGNACSTCSSLGYPSGYTSGTFSSAVGSAANTACKFTAPNKEITGCATVTSQQVTYSGTAWPAPTYGVTADAGYIIVNNNNSNATCSQCTGATYSAGGNAQQCSSCPTGYTANTDAGKSADTQCQISVTAGHYIGTAGQTSSNWGTCAAGTYKAAHTVNYNSTSSCSNCEGRTKYSASGAVSCSTVSSGYYTTGCTGNNNCTGQSQCEGDAYCTNGVKTNCASGLFAPAGAWRSQQCGHKMHVDGADYNDVMYLHSDKVTTPSYNVRWNNQTWYANMTETPTNMSTYSTHKFKASYGGKTYYVCDDTTCPQ